MAKGKPNKSILKRIRFSKGGKISKRKAGLNHFNAKASRCSQHRKNQPATFSKAFERKIKQMI
ncbi:MAG: hypothetical protein A3G49_02695 [Candidatus Sungbacteria bacterium RIFCSPLOWO2_12_FULL_41_11]|uniref:50S ribosomal protein L35 n=1 Tax=Candidatus Sungbacteria bacterium RIFCSPLOWO2_12_FULL_41_11 TaxID=1802286 RepID=A0A1G2LR56_9BACT|nr:MAG: hypothetical protein A3D41_01955 [Candidatus Sungbacteria bacterium RIFCSPHIGHO2_02_FULL_41_12b]OHA14125.1 MAG: hypothetical protein A3G49_02695 [Candidatus Sungbacteria bacterium RIFCSPLOWO2_12_FULL_41_11]